jgi:hypothetical protein
VIDKLEDTGLILCMNEMCNRLLNNEINSNNIFFVICVTDYMWDEGIRKV